jgi:hypothetical protein
VRVCVNDTDGDGNCAACARNPEAPCRVSAREELVSTLEDLWLQRCGSKEERQTCRPDAEQLVDAYAHELAEKQRTNCDKVTCGPYEAQCACKDQADLIDPEVSDGDQH